MPDILLTHGYFLGEDEKEQQIMKPYAPLGLLYISADSADVHEQNQIVTTPLAQLAHEQLCPGGAELEKLQAKFRKIPVKIACNQANK